MSIQSYIPVFVDVKPSESLDPSTDLTLCFVGILSNSMEGVPNLKAYKDTKRSNKVESAHNIIDSLSKKGIEIDAVGFAGKMNGCFVQWACDTINRSISMLGATWETQGDIPTHLNWNGERLDRSSVLGLSLYTSILPLIALRAEIITRVQQNRTIRLCLDPLPNNSKLGMELMGVMKEEKDIAKMWKENRERNARFEVGTFNKWQSAQGKWHPGKKHPNSILVDWFAVSCLANVSPDQLMLEGKYSKDEVNTLANIWKSVHKELPYSIINLDDEHLHELVKSKTIPVE